MMFATRFVKKKKKTRRWTLKIVIYVKIVVAFVLVVAVLRPCLHVNFAFLFNAEPGPRLVNIEKNDVKRAFPLYIESAARSGAKSRFQLTPVTETRIILFAWKETKTLALAPKMCRFSLGSAKSLQCIQEIT